MSIYTWLCADCAHLTEVERAMKDYETPPEACAQCGRHQLKRVMVPKKGVKGFVLEDAGGKGTWHDQMFSNYKSRL